MRRRFQPCSSFILVTPLLVRPMVPGGKSAPALDGRKLANDGELPLPGKQEVAVSKPKPMGGHIMDFAPRQPMQQPGK